MVRTISIATFATVMVLGLSSVGSATDPVKGQSSSEINSLSPRSGSPSESGKTGIGSTSGSDASIDTGLKATTQGANAPCPGQSASSAKDSTQKNSDARKKAETTNRMSTDPCGDSPVSGSQPGSQMDRR